MFFRARPEELISALIHSQCVVEGHQRVTLEGLGDALVEGYPIAILLDDVSTNPRDPSQTR